MRLSIGEVLRNLLAVVLLIAAAVLTARLIAEAGSKPWQTDQAGLNDVRYGLLDADNWAEQISDILGRRIDGFELTEENRPLIKHNIERVLDRLLQEIESSLRRRNLSGDSLIGRIEGQIHQEFQDWVLDFNGLRKKVPVYADAIMEEFTKPDAKAKIKRYLKTIIGEFVASTFSETDRSGFEAILTHHGCADAATCNGLLDSRVRQSQRIVTRQAMAVIALVVLLFPVTLFPRTDLSGRSMFLLTAATLVLLTGGVLTPMIGIEARITEFRFQLLGEPVAFQNQVLYFQSKSVTDVVLVLAEMGKADMILVAFLVGLFSIVFPLAKVMASYLYYQNPRGCGARLWSAFSP